MPRDNGKTFTYLGSFIFGEAAAHSLREADELSTQCGELLTAVGEHIAICDGIIADCKDSVERIERILGHLATKSLRC